ncbi:phosphocholine cytidylyltransferase family protein [Aeromonas sp. 1805]|uniref:phosphocholine cytidylyltransferase family protein n=1 Tax=Aeromonas TaxID=642 RepID=UPI00148AF736|nr:MULTISPECIES: phosphocholine cytidylyltransferase family protein [Aeromonas]MCO4209179.1 phosphocholine cytidylyltransferase family protein [Aeromonas hydrophila]QJT16980.1 phosphocholine cytidylyltransferase family protein [Aeromonas sp. 1805]
MTRAIILAAGRGSRMKDMTAEKPKCLTMLYGRPLLEHQLSALRAAGITDIAVVTGYMREALTSYDLVEFYNSRWAETNMVASLCCAREWLMDEECIVSYSDIFYSPEAVTTLLNTNNDVAITYDPNWLNLWRQRFSDPLSDAESFKLDEESYLIEIGNKTTDAALIQGQYMGLLKFSPVGWKRVEEYRERLPVVMQDNMHMTGTLNSMIQQNDIKIKALPYDGEWGEIDSPEDLACYEQS